MLPAALAVIASGTLAVIGADRGIRWMLAFFKPLTTALLLAVVGGPDSRFATLVVVGIILSVLGDTALLWPGNRPFMVGLALFLLAHLAYVIAFVGVGTWSTHVPIVAIATIAITAFTMRLMWKGAGSLRGPLFVYGAIITLMVATASATLGGPLARAPWAAVGAVLFYISDTSLGLDRFRAKIPHAPVLTMGIYWLGQLGIAIAAR